MRISRCYFLVAIPAIIILLLFLMPLPPTGSHYYNTQENSHRTLLKSFKIRRNFSKSDLNSGLHIANHKKSTTHENLHQTLVESALEVIRIIESSKANLVRDLYISGHESSHPELCPYLGMNLRLMILITSDPSHFNKRNAIRMTWKHYTARSDVSSGFFLGYLPVNLKAAIDAEDKLYSDIIVGRFVDTYSNLTLKTLSMLEWVNTYCYHVPKFLKTDDDVFINVPNLLRFSEAPFQINATKTIWGVTKKDRTVERRRKHFVPRIQFSGDIYPKFLLGPAYLLTSDVIKDILSAASNKTYLRLEDVFVTGLLGSELGIKRQNVVEFGHFFGHNFKPCLAKRKIAVHSVSYHQQFEYWRTLLTGRMKCLNYQNQNFG